MGAIKLFDTITPVYYWNKQSDKKVKVNQGGTNCFYYWQGVSTSEGPKPIGEISIGDYVHSYDHLSNSVQLRRVLNTYENQNSKPCIKILTTSGVIICTADHKFFFNGSYIEVEKILNSYARNKRVQPLLGFSFGAPVQQELQEHGEGKKIKAFVSARGKGRLPKNNPTFRQRGLQADVSPQGNSLGLLWPKQPNSKPQGRGQAKQRNSELGIFYPEGKLTPCIQNGISNGKAGQGQRNDEAYESPSFGNKESYSPWGEVLRAGLFSEEVRRKPKRYKGHIDGSDLELPIISVLSWRYIDPLPITYDIEVDGNHNFILSDGNVLVHNSSKTYSIMQVVIDRLVRNDNWTATVTAESWPTLERGALRDFKSIIRNSPILKFYIPNYKLKKGPFEFYNGSKLEFVTVKNPLDARHGKRQILFVNEANAMAYDTVEEMAIRSSEDVFIDYNPNAKFWVHELYQGKKHVDFFISNFRHNQYCPDDVKRNIGMYYTEWKRRKAAGDPSFSYWRNKFRVYGLGLTGIVQGVIFENVYYRPTFPMDARKKTYVIDWGYQNDPLAMALCGENQGNLYGKELIYETGLTTPRLIKRMEAMNISKTDLIVADNSNWDGIGQLKDAGYNVKPAHKPPNSRKTGVNLLLGYNIWLTEDSRNWKAEQENYKYKKIKGIFTDEPQDGDDHLWDCLRYYGQTVLVKSKPSDGKRSKRRSNM